MSRKQFLTVTVASVFLASLSLNALAVDAVYTPNTGPVVPDAKSERAEEFAHVEYRAVPLMEHTPLNASIRSTLVPGWGQSFNGEKRKGSLLFGTTVAAVALSAYFYSSSQHSYDDYKASGRVNNENYDDYTRENALTWAFGSAAAFLWVYSIVNAGNTARRQNRQASLPLQISFNSDEASVQWKKEF